MILEPRKRKKSFSAALARTLKRNAASSTWRSRRRKVLRCMRRATCT